MKLVFEVEIPKLLEPLYKDVLPSDMLNSETTLPFPIKMDTIDTTAAVTTLIHRYYFDQEEYTANWVRKFINKVVAAATDYDPNNQPMPIEKDMDDPDLYNTPE